MSKNTYPLKLPASVKKAAAELAANDGVSLNQFIAVPLAILDFLRLHPCTDSNGCVGRLIARKAPFRFSTSRVYSLMLFATRCALSCE